MKVFDVSIESVGCSRDDLSNLRYFETTHALNTLTPDTIQGTTDLIIDQFSRFLDRECGRVDETDIRTYAAIGLAGTPPKRVHGELWPRFRDLLKTERVVAIGPIGVSELEQSRAWVFFERQLEIATENDLPVIIWTPKSLPATHTYSMMARISNRGFPPSRTLFRVASGTVLEPLLSEGFHAALRVHSGAFAPTDVADLIEKFSHHKTQLTLCSKLSKDSGDVLALPKTVLALQERDVSRETINQVAFINARDFFRIEQ